jgi:hypothetical protein
MAPTEKQVSSAEMTVVVIFMSQSLDELREKDVTGVYSTNRHAVSAAIATWILGQGGTDDATDLS